MTVIKGKLVVRPTKNKNDGGLRITFTLKNGLSISTPISPGQLHPDLATQSPNKLHGLEVDLEVENDQAKRIRLVGQPWTAPQNTPKTAESSRQTTKEIQQKSSQKNLQPKKVIKSSLATQKAGNSGISGDFHNPYNFVPAPPRDHLQKFEEGDPRRELGDRAPSGHQSYQDNLWSGKISVTLTTVTPLLIPDAATAKGTDHKTYDIRMVNGKPYLPPTSITAWVKVGINFSFDVEVTNLSTVELGALLWLLSLPEGHYHRLGGGKPLGFGSVQLKIEDTDLRNGKQWHEFYSSLLPIGKPGQTTAINSSEDFQKAVELAYENNFLKVSFIAAFLQAAKGFDKPIHYPRTTKEPHPNGESFKWFVENEKLQKPYSLGFILGDQGLPILKPKQRN